MRLSKDTKSIEVNDSLTVAGIPPEVFDYRLGNRNGRVAHLVPFEVGSRFFVC